MGGQVGRSVCVMEGIGFYPKDDVNEAVRALKAGQEQKNLADCCMENRLWVGVERRWGYPGRGHSRNPGER